MSEEEKLDLTFLKTGIWKDTGKSFDQLKKLFLANYAVEKVRRPNLSGEDLIEAATLSFQGRMTQILSGKGSDHTSFLFGMTRINDYFASRNKSRISQYKSFKKDNKMDKIAEMVAKHLIKVRIVNGEEVPYAVDDRPTFGKGETKKANDNWDKEFTNRQGGHTAYLANIVMLAKPVGTPDWVFQSITVGGENSDDSFLRLKCEKCGLESPLVKCPGFIEKVNPETGAKYTSPCGNVRPELQVEQIMQSAFKFANVRLGENQTSGDKTWTNESVIEDCSEDVKELVPKWNAQEIKDRKGYERLSDEMKFLLKCDAVKDRWVNSSTLVQTWEAHPPQQSASGTPIQTYVVLWECTVTSINRDMDKLRMRSIQCIDPLLGFRKADGGFARAVNVRIPEHVWETGAKNLTEYSKIVTAGTISRREQWNRTTRQNIPGQYRDPEIDAIGIYAYDLAKPTTAPKMPVEKKYKIDDGLTTDEESLVPASDPAPEPAPAPAIQQSSKLQAFCDSSGNSLEEVQAMVDETIEGFNNQINADAAIVIVAKTLGFNLDAQGRFVVAEKPAEKPAKKVAKKVTKKPAPTPAEKPGAPANVSKDPKKWF